ncbi:MAG: alpha/beta hydrolase [Pirellula sp.]|nr:alpha/beta hydrolase [Pirellula sp.]
MKLDCLSLFCKQLGLLYIALGMVMTHGIDSSLRAAEAKSLTLKLWENGAPGATGTEAKDIPMAIVHLPSAKSPTAALVICPGGGYGGLAMGHEGTEIAKWANEAGMAAIICDYRHRGKGYGHPAPLIDAQRAIRLVRANAEQWNIDPNRVGILGFSAGGHLVSTVLTKFDSGDANASDPIAQQSSKPNFGVMAYPVILFGHPRGHRGSEVNLLGPQATKEELAAFQSDLNVTKDTPPAFLFHTQEDTGVPPENALAFYSAMVKNGVPGELHIYEKGPHGVGLGRNIAGTQDWSNALLRWLTARKILSQSTP